MIIRNKQNKMVSQQWDINFHKIVEQARQSYSKQIGKEITMSDVTRIWGKPQMVKFNIPKLRRKKWF
jgi:hypothetical protein